MAPQAYKAIPRECVGERVFILAGGPSVLGQPIDLLRGRKVIVINDSFRRAPWAPYLFSMDGRWMLHRRAELERDFAGLIMTDSQRVADSGWDRPHLLRRAPHLGLADEPDTVAGYWTSLHGATNAAVHLGSTDIVWVGADGGPSEDGRTHHHDPYPWRMNRTRWRLQRSDLRTLVEPLQERGVLLRNCSPGTKLSRLCGVFDRLEDLL